MSLRSPISSGIRGDEPAIDEGLEGVALVRGAEADLRRVPEALAAVDGYLGDPNSRFRAGDAGRKLVEANKGALRKTMSLFAEYITS